MDRAAALRAAAAAAAGPGPSSAAAAAAAAGGGGAFGASPHEGLLATLRLLRQRLKDYDLDRARDRLGQAVVRGATTGLALRGGLHLVSYVLGLVATRRGKTAVAGRPGALELIQDTLRCAHAHSVRP